MIAEFGGDAAVRYPGLLESAVMMSASRFSGEYIHESILDMGAAYLFHICKNHAFMVGNKRTALASAVIFIQLNNKQLIATDDELERLTVGVAEGSLTKNEAIEFFRKHVVAEKE
jgi:death-on-curing protein